MGSIMEVVQKRDGSMKDVKYRHHIFVMGTVKILITLRIFNVSSFLCTERKLGNFFHGVLVITTVMGFATNSLYYIFISFQTLESFGPLVHFFLCISPFLTFSQVNFVVHVLFLSIEKNYTFCFAFTAGQIHRQGSMP